MWMWMWMLFEAVRVCCSCGGRERGPTALAGADTYVHMCSLQNNQIGVAGARDLGAVLRVNTTLTSLT
jgi:hypothetical protein